MARPALLLHFAAISFFGPVSVNGLALAQDSAVPVAEQSAATAATRIDVDEQAGVVRIIIAGEERATFDAEGLHVSGDIDYTGALTDISDLRLKTDVRLLPNQAANIDALRPVAFGMANDPAGRTEYGLIAQEVEPVYPALVQVRSDGVKAVNYSGLIAPLIAAMQELQAENARLQERVGALEAANNQPPATQAEAR